MEDYFENDDDYEFHEKEWNYTDSDNYDEGLDMDQQSPEFWSDLERNADW